MAGFLETEAVARRVGRLVHLDTQRADPGLDLTVDAVSRVTGPGSLDFGGSEFEPAPGEELSPELADPGDDYGWWRLDAGTYRIRYNEALELEAGEVGYLFPLERLLRAGASHPAVLVDGGRDPLTTLLSVGEGGCHLKENCRVSRLVVVGEG